MKERITMPPGFHRTASLLATLLVVVLLPSCKDSAGPPAERVTSVTASSGDLQGGIVGMLLAQPVIGLANDAQDRPVRGALVEWAVTSGGGTITPIETETDANGHASATWTLGESAGEQSVTLTIGTASHTFVATAIAGTAATVTLMPPAVALDAIDATVALEASAVDAFDNPITGRAFTWTSDNSNIATVSSTGVVTARAQGSTQVEASLDGASGTASVTVAQVPTQIGLTPPSASLSAIGQTVQLQANSQDRNGNPVTLPQTDYTWTSSNTSVAIVSNTGLVTAAGGGVTQIMAAIGSASASAQVTVAQTATTLTVSPATDTLTTAQPARQLTVDARDSNNQVILNPSLTWSSSDPLIATVSPGGLVTAVKNGTVRIRATSGMVMDSATIVVRLNMAPVAVNDALGAIIDTPLVIVAPGVLANDSLGIPAGTVTSFGGGSLGGTVISNVAGTFTTFGTGGSLQVSANGAVAFVPSAGFNGAFTFMYRIQTLAGMSDATVTINVGSPPTTTDDAYMTTMNVPITIAPPGVLANDNLGFPVAAVASFGGGTLGGIVTTHAAGQLVTFGVGGFVGGQIRLQADGGLAFTPPTGYTGVFTVIYRLASSTGSADATITITITP
jgi:uncharacterized protein YjdB